MTWDELRAAYEQANRDSYVPEYQPISESVTKDNLSSILDQCARNYCAVMGFSVSELDKVRSELNKMPMPDFGRNEKSRSKGIQHAAIFQKKADGKTKETERD